MSEDESYIITRLAGYGQNGLKSPIRGVDVGSLLQGYDSLLDLLPRSNFPAIIEPSSTVSSVENYSERIPLTHARLHQFICNEFDLTKDPYNIPFGSRVAILLPNGPELAVVMLSVISRWCAAPINITNTYEEIKSELMNTQSVAIIILAGASRNDVAIKAAEELQIGVITITSMGSITGIFHMNLLHPIQHHNFQNISTNGNNYKNIIPHNRNFISFDHPETVLLLHTSGTSGNKKLVPYSLDMIIVGVGCIISSWNLTSADVCLNMMPLFHIGGIVRNILSPILAGGAVIACSGFDPLLFWDILSNERVKPTWYYAAPTMHHAILSEGDNRPKPLPVNSIRYIANAAGGLLPSLALSLRDTFNAIILTSYGMTECMPISSPPQNYSLDPTGTSGKAVGPDIIIADDDLNPVNDFITKGNIFIRGPPCFGGYENNGSANEESFFTIPGHGSGWFNTGDTGSLDAQGYLFISGRSKEIINRGGETISPFEIEEAIVQHPFVKETLAFSAPHDKYQETVGAIIVTKQGSPRVDLNSLHKYLDSKLHRSKWPQVLVYSEGLPKNMTGKTLRIKYAERTKMQAVDEDAPLSTRLYEAECPPVGSPLSLPIELRPVIVEVEIARQFLMRQSSVSDVAIVRVDLPHQLHSIIAFISIASNFNPSSSNVLSTPVVHGPSFSSHVDSAVIDNLQIQCQQSLDQYLVPECIFVIDSIPRLPESPLVNKKNANNEKSSRFDISSLQKLAIQLFQDKNIVLPRNSLESKIELVWRSQLGSKSVLSVKSSFFDLGGDSLKAGQLINALRKQLKLQLSVADLFTAPSIESLAQKVSTMKTLGGGSPSVHNILTKSRGRLGQKIGSNHSPSGYSPISSSYATTPTGGTPMVDKIYGSTASSDLEDDHYFSWDYAPSLSNSTFGCLFVQALPIAFLFPIRRIVIWFLIAAPWVFLMKEGFGRFYSLLAAMFIARIALGILAPLTGILLKWIIIGKYKAGRYPLWGSMYLKWWIVEQMINILGKGFFRDDLPIIGPNLVRMYYILMGAKIGVNVKIHKDAKLGQADLLTIGDDVAIDNAIIRPFSIEEGHFVLLPIVINEGCSVGLKSSVAAGSVLKSGTCIGPLSSSHEANEDAELEYRRFCRPTYRRPPAVYIIFFGIPILLFVATISMAPWFIALKIMVREAKEDGWYQSDLHSVYHAFLWWITPQRLMFFFFLRIVKRCIVPFIKLFVIIVIKWSIVGKFVPMNQSEKSTPWNRFRYWLMSRLLPGGGLAGVAKLVGTHYEVISIIYRLLGAKIGKRIYWPGSGLDIVEYDLLEVGDDVVFGSRSVVITSSTTCSKSVVIEAGSMIADRCIILPGVTVQKGAVLGSGSLVPEDFIIPVGSIWVGSQGGRAVNVSPADQSFNTKDTTTPFGKAFYEGKANYFVIPLWVIILYNTSWQAFCTCYRNCYTPLSLILCKVLMQFDPFDSRSPFELFQITLFAFIPLHVMACFIALGVDVAAKWLLLGRRLPGEYAWDQSSYCQRWQMYLTLQEIRRSERHKTGILDMIQGSQYLVWYFRALGSSIGNNVCLYPNGGDPMFTEPDLVTLGDFVGVDDASLIAHINTRGIFRLNPLVVGTGCVLKSNARLLSGANMDAHSIMLEHTLVMAGETVDSGSVWQGWPSRSQISLKRYRQGVQRILEAVSKAHVMELMSSRAEAKSNDNYNNNSNNELDVIGSGGSLLSKYRESKESKIEMKPMVRSLSFTKEDSSLHEDGLIKTNSNHSKQSANNNHNKNNNNNNNKRSGEMNELQPLLSYK
eukprot:gene6462-8890_t